MTTGTTVSGRPRKRTAKACTFCRRRKMKCNNELPVCSNCKTYAQDCTYAPDADDAGTGATAPAGAASTLTKRRQAARQQQQQRPASATTTSSTSTTAARLPSQSPADAAAASATTTSPSLHLGAAPPTGSTGPGAVPTHTPSRSPFAANGAVTPSPDGDVRRQGDPVEHRGRDPAAVSQILVSSTGVTSYHGRTSTLYEDQGPDNTESQPRMPDDWIEKGLVAEAAKQRHLEEYNYNVGNLDFDGVDPELGMHLLNLHWNRQHHSFNISYRPAFMRDMACDGPYFSKLLLNALYFGASKFSPRLEVRRDPADVRTAGWEFRGRVRKLLGSALDRSDITTIQALLVMSNSLFALGDERSAAWLYAGLAFRMIVDLGMHVEPDHRARVNFTDEDLEIRRRVFWAAFIVDKIQSLYQGRPVSLKESDTLVPIKFLDTYEDFEHWRPMSFGHRDQPSTYPGSPGYSVSTFTAFCQLSVVMGDILSVYAERTFNKTTTELSELLENLDSRLQAWKKALPKHLDIEPATVLRARPPHVFSLNVMYHVLVILLHRPFVADGHLFGTVRSISVKSFITCASAADHIITLLRAYDVAFTVARAPYLISYACYVAATIHVRIAAKRGPNSEAYNSLATCLAIFHRNQETNGAIRRARTIIQGLMARLGVPDLPPEVVTGWSGKAELAARGSSGDITLESPEGVRGHGTPRPRPMNGSDTARSTTNEPGEVLGDSPSLGWTDIDGIIQSFVRGPDQAPQPAVELTYQYATNPTEGYGQPMQAFPRYPMAATDPMGLRDYRASDLAMVWPSTMPDGSAFDDPLFGLNGAALDSFQF